MKKNLLSLFGIVLLSTIGVAQNFEWNTGATNGSHTWYGSSISQIGNTLISGSYYSFMQIDTVSRTGNSYYISMIDSTGGVKYFKNSNIRISALASDNNSNTYIGCDAAYASSETSIILDNDTIKSDTIHEKIVLAKFNPQMGLLWKKQFKPVNPSSNLFDMTCVAISTDLSGNVYALYYAYNSQNVRMDTAQFDCQGNTLVKFDANGTMLFWRHIYAGNQISVMASDPIGNIWIAGALNYNSYASSQQINFGNNVIITNTTPSSNGNSVAYIARFNSSGIAQSASFIGNWLSSTITHKGISFDSNNNAVMYDTYQFFKFSANGTYQWTKNSGAISQIKFGPEDRMYLMSYYSYNGVTVADSTFAPINGTTGSSDRALFCFDTAFNCVWLRYLKNAQTNNVIPSLEVLGNGDIYLTSATGGGLNSLLYGKLNYVDYGGSYGIYANFIEDSLSAGQAGGTPYILKLSSNGSQNILAAPTQLTITPLMAERSSGYMDLSWTDNANNETGFQIQRSLDSITWSAIDSVLADVTTYTDMTTVSFLQYYYRVAAYNNTGLSAYSNVVSATALTTSVNDASINTIMISPNPSSGKFQFSIAKATTESIQLKVTDILGKQVYTEMLPTGIANHIIDLSQLPNGIYLLHGNNLSVQKLIIQK